MTRKFYLGLLLCLGIQQSASAQCPIGRYNSNVFTDFTIDTVTYSTPYNLQMDIYQPVGDTLTMRPLIILAHGGSFISGNKNADSTVVQMCRNFAKRGYVTASINYRLGTMFGMLDSAYAVNEVVQAISDGKAAIRYFMKDAATSNTYKVDTNNIFVGGNSAGAIIYMHVGYIDSISECPSYIAAAMAANGGFEGNSGNAGYNTKNKAVINLAGALNTSAMVGWYDKPSVNVQGDADITVPYNCGYPNIGVSVPVRLCGLGQLEPAYTAKGVYHMSKVFVGDSHVPWSSNAAKFFTVDSLVTEFLYNMVCTNVAGVNTVATNTEVTVYPNPADEMLNITAAALVQSVTVFDNMGRVVVAQETNRQNFELNTAHLAAGIYYIKLRFANENNAPVVRRVVIQ